MHPSAGMPTHSMGSPGLAAKLSQMSGVRVVGPVGVGNALPPVARVEIAGATAVRCEHICSCAGTRMSAQDFVNGLANVYGVWR